MERESSSPVASEPFTAMVKPSGPACNMACDYCYYLDTMDSFPDTADFRMERESLANFVGQYIDAHPGPMVNFAWQGGEPTLLGRSFFEDVVDLQEELAPPDKRVVNSIQTNGTRLDADWCRFFAEHDFLVGVSLDGPKYLHDRYRTTKDGAGTFEDVLDGLDLLRRFGVSHSVLCVVSSHNGSHPLDVYRFFKKRDVDRIQFIPLVEPREPGASDCGDVTSPDSRPETIEPPTYEWADANARPDEETGRREQSTERAAAEAEVTDRTVQPGTYASFLRAVFDEWVRNDVGDVSVQLFEQCIRAWSDAGPDPDLCVFQETCGRQVVVEHDGDVYSCDHFFDSAHRLGNVDDTPLATLVDSPRQQAFGEAKQSTLPAYCRDCSVRFVCNGGCPKNRLLETPDSEPGLNYLCAGYRRFFRYVDPYMKLFSKALRRGEPVETVQQRVRAIDARFET